jgi:peptide/nickel transport system permease protein
VAATRSPSRFAAVFRTPLGIATVLGLLVLIALTILGPIVWGAQAAVTDVTQLSAKPSSAHPFGTDAAGRDVFARVMSATQLSVLMAIFATAIGVTLGVLVGFLPSVLPRRAAAFVVSGTGIALAFPALLLTIVLSIVVGTGATGAVLAIGLAMIPFFARLTQTMSASVRGRDYVSAARVLGVSPLRILGRHILPNVREALIVNASIAAGSALISFAGLSFLGLGVQPPDVDWGRMLNEGLSKIYVNPATALAPAVAIIVAGVVFTLLGETLARGYGIDAITNRKPKGAPPAAAAPALEQPVAAEGRKSVLSVQDLRISAPAGKEWAQPVKGVSFEIGEGEIVGLVGESGSGKSLTCLAVAGLLEDPLVVAAESVSFDGTELTRSGRVPSKLRSKTLARQLGTRMAMIFQDPSTSLNPALRIGSQVAEIGTLHEGLGRGEASKRAIDRLRAVMIRDPERRAKQYPHEFSGGMRQRTMIAMGLMGTPALIIADEPTTALDVTVQREVLGLLREVNREEGAAVLLISHDIAVITGLCTRVLVMYRGELVEQVSVTDLVEGRASHPYTRALLAAVPDFDNTPGTPFVTIPEGSDFTSGAASATADVTDEAHDEKVHQA